MTLPSRRRFVRAAALGAGAVLSINARQALGAPTTVTVASLFGADKAETRVWFHVRDEVETMLPGRFDFRIVQNAALGGEKEVAEGSRLGSIQASLGTMSALSTWVREAQILDLPFLLRDREHVRRTLDGPLGSELRQAFLAQAFVVPAFINYGARHLLGKTAMTAPADVRGKRIRVIQSPLHVALWKAFGAHPTPIPITETYNALKTGVVDIMDLTWGAYAGFKLYEVVPWVTETGHIWACGALYWSASFWARLTPAERRVFTEASISGARQFDRLIVEDEARAREQAAAGGARVVAPVDRPAWVAMARTVWAEAAPALGGMPRIEAIAGTA
jgi:TRAP-type C4-dicarboxylate transport system substrate-binding protein